MSNYYVHRNRGYDDELVHAFGFRKIGSQKPGHKYYAREGSPGHYLYFYSPAEYAAYKAGKTIKKGAANVNNRLTVGRAQARYTVKRISDTARAKVGNAVNNLTGASAKKQMQTAKSKLDYAKRQMISNLGNRDAYNKAADTMMDRRDMYRDAKSRYDKSLLGRAEKARVKVTDAAGKVRYVAARTARRGANAVSGAAGKAKEGVLDAGGKTVKALRGGADAVGKTAKRAGSAVSGAAGKAKSAASSAAGTVRKTARKAGTAVANATGYSEKQRAKRLESYANRSMKRYSDSFKPGTNIRDFHRRQVNAENALNAASQARKSYNKTAMGRAEGAARRAGSAVSDAAERVSGAARTARNAVGSAARNTVNTVKDWRKKKTTKKRPHQRKKKVLSGTATVRKNERAPYDWRK